MQSVHDRSPRLRRVVLGGAEVAGFTVEGPASSVRLLLPGPDGVLELPTWTGNEFLLASGARPLIRTLTPQPVVAEVGALAVDVVLHGEAPLSAWARRAQPGAAVAVSGPGRVDPIDADAPAYLLGGDESAIPAIEQILGWLPAETEVDVRIEIATSDARIDLPAHPRCHVTWLVAEPGAAPGHTLATSIEASATIPDRVWVAGEAAAVQRLRRHLFDERSLARASVIARGYWKAAR